MKGGDDEVVYVHGAFPVVAPNGDLLVSYVQSPDLLHTGVVCTLKVVRSTDGGDSFQTIKTQTAIQCKEKVPANGWEGYHDIRTYSSAMLAVNAYYTEDIYLAFTQLVGNDPKAFFQSSTNNGTTWSNPICLTPPSMSGWQYWPWIAVTPSGDISIVFRHSENTYVTDIMSVFSGNRGETFADPIPVADDIPRNPGNSWGRCHYIGHVAIQGQSFPVWDDYRLGGGSQADVYGTSIDLPPSRPKDFDVDVWFENPPYNSHPRLRWAQPVDSDIASYDIYRRIVDGGPPPNPGTWALYTNQPAPLTEWIDYSISYAGSGQFSARYRIKGIDQWTQESFYSDSDQVNFGNAYKQTTGVDQKPAVLQLHQNSPNPFNPNAVIGFDLPDDGNVILNVYDVLGREVATLVNEFKTAGSYTVRFDSANLASGVYLYRLRHNGVPLTRKMIVAQ